MANKVFVKLTVPLIVLKVAFISGRMRNSCRSLYHNGRGLSQSRLKALNVIHNFGLKRHDGTTAAERLFETEFPDLLPQLLGQMGEIPLPQKRKGTNYPPLRLLTAPALIESHFFKRLSWEGSRPLKLCICPVTAPVRTSPSSSIL